MEPIWGDVFGVEAVLWVVTILAAAVFGWDGLSKVLRPRDEFKSSGLGFVDDYPDAAARTIGVLELLGVAGLILPGLTGIAQILVPAAAFGLAGLMAAALAVHIQRNDYSSLRTTLALFAAGLFIGIGRIGVAPFLS